ncbi:MAG: hypothetical protein GY724_10580 [Actinomycetia bacterium]|nr:hypothetical protein [Actinomycetes bacterium]
MTLTLVGRIQTRIFLLATVGVIWTLMVVPILPRSGTSLGSVYGTTLLTLLVAGVAGVAWELLYHFIQQYRWEKDWPILFGLLLGIPEGVVAYGILRAVLDPASGPLTFILHFCTTWVLVWMVAVGPFRVVLLRWRFNGGRIV